ncbi:MAG: iron(III) transport system ATP-binding protein [Tepidanaerobacteraceae bacterium]|nr:iron(III) transport system ATP-binding protein [Tepidanaerobacteraceae bacterium]
MDEPLSSLDAGLRMDMRREIQNIHRMTGTGIIYVTHDQQEALAMADKIVVMNRGRIEQIGTPQEIYKKPETEFVARFVGKANLVKGKWEKDRFIVECGENKMVWEGGPISEVFRKKNLCPIRPEQFIIEKKETASRQE